MDPYKVLGISPNASDDEVKKAYRTMSRKYHPDNYSGKDETLAELAEEKFKQVQDAYSSIMNMRASGQQYQNQANAKTGSYHSNPFNQGGYQNQSYGQGWNQSYGQQRYSQYGSQYGRNPYGQSGCGTGNCLCDLWLADTLCECLGGDLCDCM